MEFLFFGIVVFFGFFLWKKNKNKKLQQLVARNTFFIESYRASMYKFRYVTLEEVKIKFGKLINLPEDFKTLLTLYFVEASGSALEHYGVSSELHNDLKVISLMDLGYPEDFARGMLVARKNLPPLRDISTNEVLNSFRNQGSIAYQQWIGNGDDTAKVSINCFIQEWERRASLTAQLEKIGFHL